MTQAFDFRVENIRGKDALWADAMSRLPQADDYMPVYG